MSLQKCLAFALLLLGHNVFSQVKIGGDPSAINTSSILEIESTTQGILTPRMTEAQKNAISTPANGLLIYQTDASLGFYFYDGASTSWKPLTTVASPQKFVDGTNPADAVFTGGKVGIGTLAPTANLHVESAGNTDASLEVEAGYEGNDASILLSTPFGFADDFTTPFSTKKTAIVARGLNSNSKADLHFVLNSAYSNNVNYTTGTDTKLIIKNAGNVGIGTITPSEKLDVAGNANISGNATIAGNTILRSSGTNAGENLGSVIFGNVVNATTNSSVGSIRGNDFEGEGHLVLRTSPNNSGAVERMRVTSNGTVAVGTTTPHASALVDVSSTTKGFLPPRMTANQMNAIVNPSEGLVVYCTNCLSTKGLRVFDGADWVNMNGNALAPATFTFTNVNASQGEYYTGKVLDASNTISVQINVSVEGKIRLTVNTANGYTYALTQAQAEVSVGIQTITLFASGTVTGFNPSQDVFTITETYSMQTTNVNVRTIPFGSELTAFSNGTEFFSGNSTCSSKVVSSGYTSSTCTGSVTVGSNTYNLVHINGQCWMRTNLKEASTSPCGDAPNTGCNVWNNTGGVNNTWGYYNTTTTNGTAGWRTTEPTAGRGLLYTYGAACNGNYAERAKGVCPEGFYIPSQCEYMYLFHGLGMSIANQTATAYSTTGTVGSKMSSSVTSGTNSSGFTALLTGDRNPANGVFGNTNLTRLWTSTVGNPSNNFTIRLVSNNTGVGRNFDQWRTGASLRCIRD
jgi:uncharacterized protein (TIGR02145 family)